MRRLAIRAGAAALLFLAGAEASQWAVGSIAPARDPANQAMCQAWDLENDQTYGDYRPRADGRCHPEDWRALHPLGDLW